MVAPYVPPPISEADRAAVRGAAFVDGLAVPLLDPKGRRLGPCVTPLLPDQLNLLVLYGSPISGGGLCTRLKLLQALWILSPDFVLGGRWRFHLFHARWFLASLSGAWRDSIRIALEYWHRLQFLDAPPRQAGGSVESDPPERWLAGFVLTCMTRLHMEERTIRRTPYARLLQYLAELDERSAGQRPRFNRKRDQKIRAYQLAKRRRLEAVS